MAAIHLHNALFAPDPEDSTRRVAHRSSSGSFAREHGRHTSSQSMATLRTSFSEHSYPTEPLLDPSNSGSLAYRDLLARQPMHPSGPQPGWDLGLTLTGDQATMEERKGHWEERVRRRLRTLSATKIALEVVMNSWATYNTVRYFIAFTSHPSVERQSVSLALGTSTTVSFAILLASRFISVFSQHLQTHNISRRTLKFLRDGLQYASSALLLSPAVVNFALVFSWRASTNADLSLAGRCSWDIDVAWPSGGTCEASPAWGAWLAAAIVRLVVTLLVVAGYHVVSWSYDETRRPSRSRRRHSRRTASSEGQHLRTDGPFLRMPSSDATLRGSDYFTSSDGQKHSRDGTRWSTFDESQRNSSEELRPRSRDQLKPPDGRSGSRSTSVSRPRSLSRTRSSRQISRQGSSENDEDEDTASRTIEAPVPAAQYQLRRTSSFSGLHTGSAISQTGALSLQTNDQPDTDLHGFVDRFRALVSQVTRETEEGLDFTSSEGTDTEADTDPDSPTSAAHYRSQDFGRLMNEFRGQLNPSEEDEHVRVLGEYIRRMPTIESLGSREVASIGSGSAHRDGVLGSNRSGHTSSRPPTRANTLTMSESSRPPSSAAAIEDGLLRDFSASTGSSHPSAASRSTTASFHTPASTISRAALPANVGVNEQGELVLVPTTRRSSLTGSQPSVSRSTTGDTFTSYNTAGSGLAQGSNGTDGDDVAS
ncbi:hypothetical protein PLICRDRAFT_40243 [Plicaturopsis crispa FD-325 SS-3]|nr:hypothetical protein PLICRDRAFT_40243 [Plicaturopsis crispa FD-325 SS-3]